VRPHANAAGATAILPRCVAFPTIVASIRRRRLREPDSSRSWRRNVQHFLNMARASPVTRYPKLAINSQARSSIRVLLVLALLASSGSADAQVVLDAKRHHLGIAGRPEWDEFAGDVPEGRALMLSFEGRADAREATLFIRQSNVKL